MKGFERRQTKESFESKTTASSPPSSSSRRFSSRIQSQTQGKGDLEIQPVEPRRQFRDRWYYPHPVPALMGSSDISDDDDQLRFTGTLDATHTLPAIGEGPDALILGPVVSPAIPLNRVHCHNLVRRFNAEARHRRRIFKAQLERDWESNVAPLLTRKTIFQTRLH
jgi:hypothetical protein